MCMPFIVGPESDHMLGVEQNISRNKTKAYQRLHQAQEQSCMLLNLQTQGLSNMKQILQIQGHMATYQQDKVLHQE